MPDSFLPAMRPEIALVLDLDRQPGSTTRMQPMGPARFLMNVVNGAAPLCFTPLFADSNQGLLDTARLLATEVPAYQCVLGTDLLTSPEDALENISSVITNRLGDYRSTPA